MQWHPKLATSFFLKNLSAAQATRLRVFSKPKQISNPKTEGAAQSTCDVHFRKAVDPSIHDHSPVDLAPARRDS